MPLSSVLVVGAGVVGLSVALELQAAGHAVDLIADRALSGTASAAAAGMIAPGSEAAADSAGRAVFELFCRAREAWPDFLYAHARGVWLCRRGAVFVSPEASERVYQRERTLQKLGAASEIFDDYAGLGPGVFTPEDWRIDVGQALEAFLAIFALRGGRISRATVVGATNTEVVCANGDRLRADAVVVASGFAPYLAGLPLQAIGGQLSVYHRPSAQPGPVLRTPEGYLTQSETQAVFGATMEFGVTSLAIDPEIVGKQRRMALRLDPSLDKAAFSARRGVRAATPDGLPLVGSWGDDAPILALGMRRNGWLLAPYVAAAVRREIEGLEPSADLAFFYPRRNFHINKG